MCFYLYVKTHTTTGLKYLGQTQKDPQRYRGSGLHWKRHIKKHGYHVITDVIGTFGTHDQLKEAGLYYSELWNIVESDQWANLMVESGDSALAWVGKHHSLDSRRKMSDSSKNKTKSFSHRRSMSIARRNKPLNTSHRQNISSGIKKWWAAKKLSNPLQYQLE